MTTSTSRLMVKGARTIYIADRAAINARHPEVNRRAKHQPFPNLGTLVEGTGRHREDRIDLTAKEATDARGRPQMLREWGVPMSGVSARVRSLGLADVGAIRIKDEEIERAIAALKVLRDEREALVRAAWRKGNHSVTGADLERLAVETTRRDLVERSA